jgi:hypothetical protein
MTTGAGNASDGTGRMASDEPVVTLTRGELRAMVAELMAEHIREMRPDSAEVKDVGGKPAVTTKCYANGVEEAITRALAAYHAGKNGV